MTEDEMNKMNELRDILASAFQGEKTKLVVTVLAAFICTSYVTCGASEEEGKEMADEIMTRFKRLFE